ncbi:Hypothetical_protein [Hexamita inflata]|uniref:Hypothetical_protein n=1 Tax=Hexamita inflata TaxID=28002 RepID=A0AA86NPK1_9EUKA|nr:Hypothetical protein HINF_LOCUS11410 [Hexamita inflata]
MSKRQKNGVHIVFIKLMSKEFISQIKKEDRAGYQQVDLIKHWSGQTFQLFYYKVIDQYFTIKTTTQPHSEGVAFLLTRSDNKQPLVSEQYNRFQINRENQRFDLIAALQFGFCAACVRGFFKKGQLTEVPQQLHYCTINYFTPMQQLQPFFDKQAAFQ